jgi:hypothetical protein
MDKASEVFYYFDCSKIWDRRYGYYFVTYDMMIGPFASAKEAEKASKLYCGKK